MSPDEYYNMCHPINLPATTRDDCVNMMKEYAIYVSLSLVKHVATEYSKLDFTCEPEDDSYNTIYADLLEVVNQNIKIL